jgi:hypothetical protein
MVIIASPGPPGPGSPLPETDLHPVLDAFGQFDIDRLAIGQCDALIGANRRIGQVTARR